MEISSNTIFGKRLNEVTVTDVRDFCDRRIPEGINLDYKKDLSSSKSILKAIASFGNTSGGWIIVGVDDEDDIPKLPATGMDFKKQIPLDITNIVLSGMYPALIPVVHVCTPDKDNKTFIVIHVPESAEAPHWVFNKKELYVRVAQRTNSGEWFDLATSDQWEWLRNKREKSSDLRKSKIQELEFYFSQAHSRNELVQAIKDSGKPKSGFYIPPVSSTSAATYKPDIGDQNMLTLVISPMFPRNALLNVPETFSKLQEVSIHDYFGTEKGFRFPIFLNSRQTFQEGTFIYNALNESREYFTALNTLGIYMFKETVLFYDESESADDEDRINKSFIDFYRILTRIEEFLRTSANLYSSIGFEGLIYFYVHIFGDNYMELRMPSMFPKLKKHLNPNDEFVWNKESNVRDLQDEAMRYSLISEVIQTLLYAFDWQDFDWEKMKAYFIERGLYTSVLGLTTKS